MRAFCFCCLGVFNVFDMIKATGWPIWPLLLASVIALAIIIERLMALRRARIVPSGLLESVLTDLREIGVSPVMVGNVAAHSPLGVVLAAGLRNINCSREVMKEAIEEAGRAVAHELGRFLITLGTIAAISPLLGLFGTVIGMIDIFSSQGVDGADPRLLAKGIAVALNTTAVGLIIAIPATIFWRHFRALVKSFVIEMEQQAIALVEVVHGERTKV